MSVIECCHDMSIREKYSRDRSSCKAVIPKGVFFPQSTEEVSEIVRKALEEGFFISIWGGGSGVNGGAIPLDTDEYLISLRKWIRWKYLNMIL